MNFHDVKKVTMATRDNGDDVAWTSLKVSYGAHIEVDRKVMEEIAEVIHADKKVVREVIRELNFRREGIIEDEVVFFHSDEGFKFQIGEDD
jgi:hypothetical protein